MLIIGHRGAAGLARENTLSSLKKAEECGVDMIETDLRKINNKIVLTHDRVSDPNLVTLEEALNIFKIPWNLELKEAGFESEVLALVKQFSSEVLISSFQVKILEKVRTLDEKIKLGYVFNSEESTGNLVDSLNLYSLHPSDAVVNPYTMEQFRKRPVKVFVWTVNSLIEFERLKKLGVDGVFTDRPDLIKR